MRVTNLIGAKGKPAANQFLLTDGNKEVFQSYKSIIAEKYDNGDIWLDSEYWDYSVTTLKFLKIFLNISISKKEIQAKIDSGEYLIAEFN